jgi:transposase
VLFHNFNWKNLSLIAGLTIWNLYFEIFTESIKSQHIIVFLEKLKRVIPGKMLIVWDGLSCHRSKMVRQYLETEPGRIEVLRLPAYAPELNPVEYIWAHLKQHELPNVCSKDFWSLGEAARHRLKRMGRRKRILTACWKQSSLAL